MNWEALSAVGELVGGIAVVATPIYPAIQVGQITLTSRAARRQAITQVPMWQDYWRRERDIYGPAFR